MKAVGGLLSVSGNICMFTLGFFPCIDVIVLKVAKQITSSFFVKFWKKKIYLCSNKQKLATTLFEKGHSY